ncbi:MAG: extracellular solute-binding protein [Chloroflexi bacterium]|nr:extracellular solute-binding protein [Chloroflexota bacterium]
MGSENPTRDLLQARVTRRRWLVTAGLVAGAGLLTACSGAGPAPATSATSAPTAAAAAAAPAATTAAKPAAQAVTLTMWGNHPECKDPLTAFVGKYTSANPGVTINLDFKRGEDYNTALSTAIAGGAAPDIIGFGPGTSIPAAAAAGQINDLTGKVPVENLITAASNQVKDANGKVWGSPLAAYTVGMFYQRPIFQKYSINPPTTWDELIAACKQLKDAGVTPIEMPGKDGILPYFLYMLAASSILGEQGSQDLMTGKVKLTDDKLLPAAKLMTDLQPYFSDGFESVAYAEGKAEFANAHAAMIPGGSADYTGYKQVNPNVDVGVFGFPPQSTATGKPTTVTGMELIYTVNSKTSGAGADAAAGFVGWLATSDAQQIVANTIAQPVVKGVASTQDRVAKEMTDAGQTNVPVWHDTPQFANALDVFAKDGMGVFSGRLSPADMAKAMQDGIKTGS